MALAATGNPHEGEQLVRRSLKLRPDRAHFWSNLGNLLNRSARKAEAIEAYGHSIALDERFADARANLAGAFASLERYDDAQASAESALALAPDHVTALANLAGALIGRHRFADAEAPLQRAMTLDPMNYDVWYNLGHLRMARGRAEESEQAFRRAVELAPDSIEAIRWLGYACVRTRKGEEAERHLRRFLAERPEPSNAYSILGHLHVQRGLFDEGLALLRKGVGRPSAQSAEHSTLVFDMNYLTSADPVEVRAEHERWAKRFALPHVLHNEPARTDTDPVRRIRVGFISPDFRGHSVSFFFLPVLRNLDRMSVETFCYAFVDRPDDMTTILQQAADHWRDVSGQPDEEIAQRVREDRIDILVDLAGHTSDNRLLVLARRPAPVQATYLGYPNTTGMSAVDWRIVDGLTDPAHADALAVERLLRLDRCFLAYQPLEYPEVTEPPCLANGHVTFGSFNNMAKLNDAVFEAWAAILDGVPDSRLLLKHDMSHDPVVRDRVMKAFTGRGIEADRIELLERTRGRADHLATYGRVDIALDSFPYNGTTTTCEALWMGVPVVTLAGIAHAGRVGASLLQTIGLESCVAADRDEYVLTAAQLAASPALLSTLRQMLRGEMAQSPLMDEAGLGKSMTTAFRTMWHDYCERRVRS
jgi:predicted O-linked N-acetylglucosamine transferase (SPINDLY family)